jgi:hypothetical protein
MLRRAAWQGLFVLLALAIVRAQATAHSHSSESAPQAPVSATPAAPPANEPAPAGSTQDLPAANSAVTSDRIAAGTEIHAVLDTPLSTRTSRPGDRFTATVSDSARGNGGIVVIPAGARVEGEVAEPDEGKATAALREKGALSLRFRNVVLPSGETLPLAATLISVHDTGKNARNANEEGRIRSSTHGSDVAGNKSIGAAGGVVFGGPIKGLAIAPLAGGCYVLSTKTKDVILSAQTGMVIRLDQPVSSSGSETPRPR